LNFLGVFKISVFKGNGFSVKSTGFFSSVLFGIVFSIGWTPCVGAFLGSALMLAANRGSLTEGVLMLLCYSLGLGLPFLISSVLIDKLKSTFGFIKKHYKIINIVSGALLVVVGVLMVTGLFGKLLSILS
jgi:cytochrome c-type biogenesis protein